MCGEAGAIFIAVRINPPSRKATRHKNIASARARTPGKFGRLLELCCAIESMIPLSARKHALLRCAITARSHAGDIIRLHPPQGAWHSCEQTLGAILRSSPLSCLGIVGATGSSRRHCSVRRGSFWLSPMSSAQPPTCSYAGDPPASAAADPLSWESSNGRPCKPADRSGSVYGTWNRHDMQALAALFAEDANFVKVVGPARRR
jgi:hypothetical protein